MKQGIAQFTLSAGGGASTCFTRGRPGENFLLVMAGFPIPIFRVMGTTVVDSSDTLELDTSCYTAEQQRNSKNEYQGSGRVGLL